jgi:5-methylcytosine-specific restriction endonuclease McrA
MTNLEKKADIEWSQAVKRITPCCVKCGFSGSMVRPLQAAHIIRRSHGKALKWDLLNGMTLCLSCHYRFDEQFTDEQREEFVVRLFGRDRWDYLQRLKNSIAKPTESDMKETIKSLQDS